MQSAKWPDAGTGGGGPGAVHSLGGGATQRDWWLLAGATLAFSLGFGIYLGLFPTFASDHLGLAKAQLGVHESLREVPGLLSAGIVGILAGLAEPRLALLALGITAAGIGLTGQADGFAALVACSMFWSIGLHIWLIVQPALTLALSPPGRHGWSLGMMARYGSVAILAGLLFVWLTGSRIPYGAAFAAAGTLVAVGCIAAAAMTRGIGHGLRQRLLFRSRYRLYYLLMLLDGGRRVLIQTFVVLVLAREFGLTRGQVAAVMFAGNALTMLAAPAVGAWVDRYGERRVLSVYYALAVCVFIAYTQVGTARLFCGIFLLDTLLFTGAVGIPTYARHLCPERELSATLAMGLTMNHVAAVSVPLVAGYLWATLGYRTIFWCGAALALVSLAGCAFLPRRGGSVGEATVLGAGT